MNSAQLDGGVEVVAGSPSTAPASASAAIASAFHEAIRLSSRAGAGAFCAALPDRAAHLLEDLVGRLALGRVDEQDVLALELAVIDHAPVEEEVADVSGRDGFDDLAQFVDLPGVEGAFFEVAVRVDRIGVERARESALGRCISASIQSSVSRQTLAKPSSPVSCQACR